MQASLEAARREAWAPPRRAMKTPNARLALTVQYAVPAATLPAAAALRRWARAALERDATVTLRFVGTREGRALNARFRGKDYATNVLTFVYDGQAALEGDIVLCAPVLRREAKEQHKALREHCAHLVVHGMLHLQGYDHDHPRAARAMERREAAILATFAMPDPYADPGSARLRAA
jgi:probable rRNA maturation factor